MIALTTPTDTSLVERCAEAAYNAAMTTPKDHPQFEPWGNLPDYWKRLYRVQAAAIINLIGEQT